MIERTIVITGGTGGIGMHSAIGIAKTSPEKLRVIITGRNQERGEAAVERIKEESKNTNIELIIGDIGSKEGVDALAGKILEKTNDSGLDVLVNNAGYLGDTLKKSDDGLEMHFAVNVRSPYRLTLALLPALKRAAKARVINVSGGNDKPERIDVDDLQAEKGFKGLMTYGHSKSVLEAASMALAKKLEPDGVTLTVVFPGRASTAMTGTLSMASLPGIMKLFYPLFKFMFRDDGGKSAQKAATSTIFAATSADLEGVTGKYYNTDAEEEKLHPTAYDPQIQARIIEVIESAN